MHNVPLYSSYTLKVVYIFSCLSFSLVSMHKLNVFIFLHQLKLVLQTSQNKKALRQTICTICMCRIIHWGKTDFMPLLDLHHFLCRFFGQLQSMHTFTLYALYVCVCVCSILGGRALGLGFSRPQVQMCLMREQDIRQCQMEQKPPYPVIAGTVSDCTFFVDAVGQCKAEFHSNRVENLHPQNGKNAVPQKYAFVFRTAVSICGCQFTVEVRCSTSRLCRF